MSWKFISFAASISCASRSTTLNDEIDGVEEDEETKASATVHEALPERKQCYVKSSGENYEWYIDIYLKKSNWLHDTL